MPSIGWLSLPTSLLNFYLQALCALEPPAPHRPLSIFFILHVDYQDLLASLLPNANYFYSLWASRNRIVDTWDVTIGYVNPLIS